MKRIDLPGLLEKTLISLGGRGTIVEICKAFWERHEKDLRNSGDLFYTWQYDIRWAATKLREDKKLKSKEISPKGVWELV
ncbi:hypothetical protein [Lutispora sp.]|uniref:hypothetical protein n=1 Tax=Lutispora sp. TaxID=2828727 RepID=UPI002B1F39AD|nr:hypothetical protein [Lutispora sp.]MEA4961095.1 hypothetical protein [Lutispora sp.]